MDLFGAIIEDPLHDILQLRTAYDRVLAEEQALPLDQLGDRNQLHARHHVTHLLHLRHEAARPGGGILDEGPAVGHARLNGVADGMRRAGIRDPGHNIHLVAVVACQGGPAAVARVLHVDAFVGGGGVAVVDP